MLTYNNISATNFSLYLRHFRRPVPLQGFTAIGFSRHIKSKHKIYNIFGLEKLLWMLLGSRAKKYHTLPLLQTRWVTFCSIDCKADFHRKKYHHPEVRNTNKWCCCWNINAKLRNWETIKNKPFASKQLFLKVHVFTVFSNKYIFLGLRLARKCGLEEPQRRSQEFPLRAGYGIPELLLWAHQIDSPYHHFSSCKRRKVSTFFTTFGGQYEWIVLQNHNTLLFPVLCSGWVWMQSHWSESDFILHLTQITCHSWY